MDVKELMTLNGISIRGDIHTQVATLNIDMTFGRGGGGLTLMMLEWIWQNEANSIGKMIFF